MIDVPTRTLIPGSADCQIRPNSLPPGALGANSTIDCAGFEIVQSPKWSGSAGYTHRFDLNSGAAIEAGGVFRLASSRWLATGFVPAERAPAYQTLDGSPSYITPGGKANINAFIRNITNETVYQAGFQGPFQPNVVVASIQPPRTYGIRFSVRCNRAAW